VLSVRKAGHVSTCIRTHENVLLPEARVVKAFNIVGNPHMVNPDFPNGGPPAMFLCGNDNESKKIVTDKILAFSIAI
jgi:predicted dinucleotide-binding enzyme